LKLAADAIRNTARRTDVPARYGGDEFVLLLPNTREAGALQLADRLREAIHHCQLSVGEQLTASIGVSVYHPDDKHSEDLLVRADRALYQAKAGDLGVAVLKHPDRAEAHIDEH
ncbi:GGDEF domain-containing protein, partial [bacterium]